MASMKSFLAVLCSVAIFGVCAAGDAETGNTAKAIANTVVMAQHAAVEFLDKNPPPGPVDLAVKECLRKLEVEQVEGIAQEFLATRLDEGDLRVADKFFATTSGQKYLVDGEINAYKLAGLEPHKTSVKRTPEEQQDYDAFFASSAGQKLLGAMSDRAQFSIPLNMRILEIVRACADSGKQAPNAEQKT
jgi:hypothetical protein